MKRILYLLGIIYLSNCMAFAQEQSDSPWDNSSSNTETEDSPWKKDNQTSSDQSHKPTSGTTTTSPSTGTTTTTTTLPKTTGTPGISTEPTPVPIDGGIVVLLAAGALYGRRRIKSAKKVPLGMK